MKPAPSCLSSSWTPKWRMLHCPLLPPQLPLYRHVSPNWSQVCSPSLLLRNHLGPGLLLVSRENMHPPPSDQSESFPDERCYKQEAGLHSLSGDGKRKPYAWECHRSGRGDGMQRDFRWQLEINHCWHCGPFHFILSLLSCLYCVTQWPYSILTYPGPFTLPDAAGILS